MHIGEGAELSLHHLTLAGSDGRLILNRGVLHVADVRLTNDSGGPNYTLPDGGGIANYGTLTLTRTQLDHNRILTATTPGRAIWNAGTLTATCATFADNRASKGGAVWNAAGGQTSFTKVNFAGNVANGGGAVFNADTAHIVQITDGWWGGATPVFNDATQGTDTLGGLVSYTAAASDPLAAPDCQSPAPEPPPAGNTGLFSAASVPDGSSVQLPASIPPGGVARGKIAFMSNRNGNNDIYVMDTNGANVVQVTNTANEWEYAPVWSPDGQKLVYKSSIGSMGRWTIITPGTSADPVWIDANTPYVEQASWFPNSQYLALPRDGDLYRVQADGQNATKILDNDLPALRFGAGWVSTQIRSVAWSPTGTHIAFITHVVYHDGYDESYHLYVAEISAPPGMPPSPDLSSIRYITDIWSSEPLAPVWSPNGQEIALWKPDLIAFNVTSLQTRTLIYNPFYIPSGGQVRIYGWNWSRYDQTAFSVPDPTTYRRWIHLADPVGGALSQNGNTQSYSDYYPDFSPDACFGYESGGVCRIGQDLVQITATPLPTATPSVATCDAIVSPNNPFARVRVARNLDDDSWIFLIDNTMKASLVKSDSNYEIPPKDTPVRIQANLWAGIEKETASNGASDTVTWLRVTISWTINGSLIQSQDRYMAIRTENLGEILSVPCEQRLPGYPTPTSTPIPTNTSIPSNLVRYVTCANLTGGLNAYDKSSGNKIKLGEIPRGMLVVLVNPSTAPIVDGNIERVEIYWPAGSSQE